MNDLREYHFLLSTLRLYAGWLLACLAVVYMLGTYQQLRILPYEVPMLDEWMDSPLIPGSAIRHPALYENTILSGLLILCASKLRLDLFLI